MDEFDFLEEKAPRKRFRLGAALMNLITLGIVTATLAAGGLFTYIFYDPFSAYNPFPPVAVTEEPTATDAAPLPTEEAEASPTATATSTPTAVPSATTIPSVTPTYVPGSRYGIQNGSPAALDGSVFYPNRGCNFMAVAGQAFGLNDAPIAGLSVQVTGTLGSATVNKIGVTGAATAYGNGSYYEIELANAPIASDDTLSIGLVDGEGKSISTPLTFDTNASCSQNLILINFKAQP
ncbi:MAG: hypothetical protein DWG76_04015 [Chloroflexi bacterium]|nr:hypothetical protein [Chloroflexota bacterium]